MTVVINTHPTTLIMFSLLLEECSHVANTYLVNDVILTC